MEAVERRENRQQPLGLVRNPAVITNSQWLFLSLIQEAWAIQPVRFLGMFELWCPRTSRQFFFGMNFPGRMMHFLNCFAKSNLLPQYIRCQTNRAG